jgi:hypothetical protein
MINTFWEKTGLGSIVLATSIFSLESVEYWENRFLDTWDSEYDTYYPASLEVDSWKFYNLGYALSANAAMYEATGKTDYLDRTLLYIENTMSTARPSSEISDSQFDDDYLGWPNRSHPAGARDGYEYPLFESYCYRYVATILRLIKADDDVFTDPDYRERYDNILAFTQIHMWEKWATRGMSNLYRVNTHMASHWARIGLNLSLIVEDPEKAAEYREVFDHFNHDLPNYSSSMRDQIRPNPQDEQAYWWNANWESFSMPGQDVSHGNAVVSFMVEAHDVGEEWNDEDMAALVRLLDRVIWPSSGEYAEYLDGSGNGNGWFNDGFVNLGRFDEALQERLESHTVGRGTQLYGNLALNAKKLLEPEVQVRSSFPQSSPYKYHSNLQFFHPFSDMGNQNVKTHDMLGRTGRPVVNRKPLMVIIGTEP